MGQAHSWRPCYDDSMRRECIFVALVVSALLVSSRVGADTTPSAKRCPTEILPGTGIGPIEVGVTVESLKKRGVQLVTDEQFSGMKRYKDLLILLSPDGQRIQTVELSRERFGRCVRVGSVALTKAMTMEQMAARLGRCGPLDMRTGGTIVPCGDGLELRNSASGVGILVAAGEVSSAPKTICETYVSSGEQRFVVHRGERKQIIKKFRGAALDVNDGGPICHGALVFTAAVTKERYKYEFCSKVEHPTYEQLNCGDLGHRFGADGALHELLLFPYALDKR